MNKITKTSRALSMAFFFVCGLYPLMHLYAALEYLPSLMSWTLLPSEQLSHFSTLHQSLIIALSYTPVVFTVIICFQLGQLFRLYEKAKFFEQDNIGRIHCIGKYMLIGQVIQCLLYEPLMMWILTYTQPVGHRLVMFSFGTASLSTLVTGVIIIVASWIATEAHQLKTEVQLTI